MKFDKKQSVNPSHVMMGAFIVFAMAILMKPLFIPLTSIAFGLFLAALYKYAQVQTPEEKENRAIEEKIQHQLNFCQSEFDKVADEMDDINENVRDIDDKLRVNIEIHETSRKESLRLRNEFAKELELRKSKLNFYKVMIEKLKTLLYNHKLTQDLAAKKAKLEALQEDHFEDIAKMESIKTEFELDKQVLTTLEDLSNRMSSTRSADSVEELSLELVQITKELRRI